MEYPDLKRAVRDLRQTFGANVVLIEDSSSGMPLVQELNREGPGAVIPCKAEGDKEMRLRTQTALIEAGRVYLPTSAPWLEDYLHELTMFPNSKHDDQVDSTSQFLDWFTVPRMKGWGIYEATRRQALALQAREESWVRLKAPPGLFGSVQTLTGRHANLDDDRTVVVCEEDAEHLSGQGWTRIGPAPVPKELQPEPECPYAKGCVEHAAWQEEQKRRSEAVSRQTIWSCEK